MIVIRTWTHSKRLNKKVNNQNDHITTTDVLNDNEKLTNSVSDPSLQLSDTDNENQEINNPTPISDILSQIKSKVLYHNPNSN